MLEYNKSQEQRAIAEKLKVAIDDRKIDRKRVAKICGVTEQAVSNWIKTGKVAKRHLPKIATLSGLELDYFFNDKSPGQTLEGKGAYIDKSELPILEKIRAYAAAGVLSVNDLTLIDHIVERLAIGDRHE